MIQFLIVAGIGYFCYENYSCENISKGAKRCWDNRFNSNHGSCYTCCKHLFKGDHRKTWHVGHIKSDKHGGTRKLNNVVPICIDCNNSRMKEMHAHLYMLYFKTEGVKNLDLKNPEIMEKSKLANDMRSAVNKINVLASAKKINKTMADKHIKEIESKKASDYERRIAINSVSKLCQQLR